MSKVFGRKAVITRKPHVCFGCGREYPSKTKMERAAVFDGDMWACYLCETCIELGNDMEFDDEFGFSDLREDAFELERKKAQEGAEG